MDIIKIHPYDLYDLLEQELPDGDILDVFKGINWKTGEEILTIRGQKYLQTTDVPPKNKNFV